MISLRVYFGLCSLNVCFVFSSISRIKHLKEVPVKIVKLNDFPCSKCDNFVTFLKLRHLRI